MSNKRMIGMVFLLLGYLFVKGEVREESGRPFYENFPAEVYDAHDRNEAVVCDGEGNYYFANFEGILKYDGQSWSLVTTPGISRITALAVGKEGQLYAGGFNVAGRLEAGENGEPVFRTYWSDIRTENRRIGEVLCILEKENEVLFVAQEALVWVKADTIRSVLSGNKFTGGFRIGQRMLVQLESGMLMEFKAGELTFFSEPVAADLVCKSICELSDGRRLIGTNGGLFLQSGRKRIPLKINHIPKDIPVSAVAETTDGKIIVATTTHGVFILNQNLTLEGELNEEQGLCSNVVNDLVLDGKGILWLATGKGVARVWISSMYSLFTEREGLAGEVLAVMRYEGDLYVGTYRGLFYLEKEKGRFRRLGDIDRACWQLTADREGNLWVASSGGLFRVSEHRVIPYSHSFTMSVEPDPVRGHLLYTGEQNAVYSNRWLGNTIGKRQVYAPLGQVIRMGADREKEMWLSTVFGEVYKSVEADTGQLLKSCKGLSDLSGNRLMRYKGKYVIVAGDGFYREITVDSVGRFSLLPEMPEAGWWPGMALEDAAGRLWLTAGDGKDLFVVKDGQIEPEYSRRLEAVGRYNTRVIYPEENVVWLGGSFGLVRVDLEKKDLLFESEPSVYIRKVMRRKEKPRDICFSFAADVAGVIRPVVYSCKLTGFDRHWSEWKEEGVMEYMRLPYGKYVFEVRCRDIFGKISRQQTVSFEIMAPFYLKWYAWVSYALLFIVLVGLFMKWRTRKLVEEKMRLELIVERRTEEIRTQRDEIRMKSDRLEQTLIQLNKAQDELVRQEKMATVGKLTQGLVDRILNPLNYIGNFALLSQGLATEALKVLEEEEGEVQEMKADLTEIVGMLSANLVKISEHGESTARILKAMEEILRERKCVLLPVDMNELCRENIEVLKKYFDRDIGKNNINLYFDTESDSLTGLADARQLGKVLLSILNNGILALLKKIGRCEFVPELKISLRAQGDYLQITVRDNGIGIEPEILGKVFDPFFTTRTTAEAAGVGLYLSREVVLNHGGRITVDSQKGEWTTVSMEIRKAD